jgi:GNAT superfamily N-acetyltransferase
VNINIREAQLQDEALIGEHLYQLAKEVLVPAEFIESNYQEITQKFIANARQEMNYGGFIAEVNEKAIASVSCQLYEKPYPQIIKIERRQWGYIWGLYVEPDYRGQGIGSQLMNRAIKYLKSLGCSRAILHTSPLGKPIYERLGFTNSNELFLDL